MVKFVHCTVIETSVSKWAPKGVAGSKEDNPDPRLKHDNIKNTYHRHHSNCCNEPSWLDYRA